VEKRKVSGEQVVMGCMLGEVYYMCDPWWWTPHERNIKYKNIMEELKMRKSSE